MTLALTLFIYYLAGYTLNRVTLFALIFSIGILVDDAVVVENIERHIREKRAEGRPLWRIAVEAVDEVGNPTILATFTVIAAILPMAFVRGLMGPYMRPIPTHRRLGGDAAPLAVAFIVSPWAAVRIFRGHRDAHREPDPEEAPEHREGRSTRLYRPDHRAGDPAGLPLGVSSAHRGGPPRMALAMVGGGLVKVEVPLNDESKLQVLIDHDEGTPLEATLETARQSTAR